MARYLIQDHRFLDSFLGAALASADTFEARLRLAAKIDDHPPGRFRKRFSSYGGPRVRISFPPAASLMRT